MQLPRLYSSRSQAKRKVLLTGTPLQNNLVELMSLLTFVMPNMFGKKADQIKLMFSAASKNEEDQSRFERDRIEHAKKLMRPFLLRRLKRDVLQQLPTKHEEVRPCTMTPYQHHCYVTLVAALSKEVGFWHGSCRRRAGGGCPVALSGSRLSCCGAINWASPVPAEYSAWRCCHVQFKENNEAQTGMMMKLRRASNHPLLLRNHYDQEKLRAMSQVLLKVGAM